MPSSPWSARSRIGTAAVGVLAAALLAPGLPGASAADPAAVAAGSGAVPLARLTGSPALSDAARSATGEPTRDAVRAARAAQAAGALPTSGEVVLQLELATPSTSRAFAGARPQGLRTAALAADSQAVRVDAAQDSLVARLSAPATRADVLFRTSHLLSAVVVRTDARRIRALAALPGVRSVRPIAAKFPQNASAVPLTRAPAAWEALKNAGKGANVAIVDTGIDYTHADLGGAGTPAAFAAADAIDTVITPDGPAPATPTLTVDNFPTAKVTQGYDLVGDAYNAGYEEEGLRPGSPNAVPAPDPNPLDCAEADGGGHGTHVSGTVAGTGVKADRTAYTGPYDRSVPFGALHIGPGTAPEATLSAYRVFGCTGASFVISQALDLIAATRTDGDARNDVDVMNLSLGADFTRADDPDAVNIDRLALLGVTPVISAGNPGDLYGSAGSPGSAVRALTVAASDDGSSFVDALQVTAPASLAGNLPGVLSVRYVFGPTRPGVTDVATARPSGTTSCAPYSAADAALVAGKVAIVDAAGFTATPGGCGSVAKTGNAKAAGAVGVVIIDDNDRLATGITGDADIPAILVTKTDGAALLAASGLRVSINAESVDAAAFRNDELVDTPAAFTARAGTLGDGLLKPDVAAPGVSITSARAGTGSDRWTISGTSMAAPHTAGIAALVNATRPDLSAEQVKAAIVNTAIEDITEDPTDAEALVYTPARVGTGRVRADLATSTEVLAYAAGGSGAVGVGLGPVDVTAPTQTITRDVTVQNLGVAPRTYAVATQDDLAVPGATWSAAPASITVAPGATATVALSVRLTRDELRKALDPTFERAFRDLREHFISESLGKLLLTPAQGTQLRVAYGVAPRPASTTTVAPAALSFPAAGGTAGLTVTGSGVANGPVGELTSVNSVVSGYQLQTSSPLLPQCGPVASGELQQAGCILFPSQRAADLRYVGAASTAAVDGADGLAVFGLATYSTWVTPSWNYPSSFVGDVRFRIFVDTDGNGTDDRLVDVERGAEDTDLLASNLYDISALPVGFTDDQLKRATPTVLLDQQLLNGQDGSFDTNVLQSDVLAVPVSIAAMRLPAGASTIAYRVVTETLDSLPIVLDSTPRQLFDVADPAISVVAATATTTTGGSTLFLDRPGTVLPVTRSATTTGALEGLLLLHHHAANGARAEVVPVVSEAGPSDPGGGGPGASSPPSAAPTASGTPSAGPSASSSPGSPGPSVSPAACATRTTVALPRSTITATESAAVTVSTAPNSVVDLYAYTRPSTTYRVVRSAEVGPSGVTQFRVVPPRNTRLYAQQRGCPADPGRDSRVLSVRTALSLSATRLGPRTYRFSGGSLPARPGGLVVSLYRVTSSGSQVLTAQTRASATTGRWVVDQRFRGSGLFGFVVRTGTDLQNAAGASNVRRTLIY